MAKSTYNIAILAILLLSSPYRIKCLFYTNIYVIAFEILMNLIEFQKFFDRNLKFQRYEVRYVPFNVTFLYNVILYVLYKYKYYPVP